MEGKALGTIMGLPTASVRILSELAANRAGPLYMNGLEQSHSDLEYRSGLAVLASLQGLPVSDVSASADALISVFLDAGKVGGSGDLTASFLKNSLLSMGIDAPRAESIVLAWKGAADGIREACLQRVLQGTTHKLADFEWVVGVTTMGSEGDAGKCFIRLSIVTSDGQKKCIELDMNQLEIFIRSLETTKKQLKQQQQLI